MRQPNGFPTPRRWGFSCLLNAGPDGGGSATAVRQGEIDEGEVYSRDLVIDDYEDCTP